MAVKGDGAIIINERIEQQLLDIRRHLHQYPELSHEEYETTAYIRERLEETGIRIAAQFSLKTGLIAEVGGLQGGPVIALRADIDALPILEETGLPFSSKNTGKMHACGHDFHTAAILGAALLLKEKEHELPGTVRFVFQPAEEKAAGAEKVLQSGALEGVCAIYGMHNKPDLPVGTIGIRSGPLMAAADGFLVEFEGIGSHAAVPEASVDPIVAAAHLVTALQTIVSRNVSPLDSAVISVTRLNSGTAWNVIPETAVLDGTVRTFDELVRTRVIERFSEVVNGIAAAYGTKAAVRWIQGPPPVNNDAELAEAARRTAEQLGIHVVTPKPSLAGEDFAFYQKHLPGFFAFMGTGGQKEWHHPAFDVDERALPISASFFAGLAIAELKRFVADP
ncbi:amidohydrolase [Paenibacillus radicis (ex Xue et al. 2023)]|uniref:Amidohydrolase n=1 Tax=Paenibacillus radicis (ex Xue et al. 2023) TaxID=2972489 RepID=A0ABT1YM73_9BACL|nr:amidohydrolase [Paenibacillus radicis (ex Xue et al. 2023)]MCR8634264.1 amidohydrolase [Paenibacillus radicis (ex Xue et al. 2023)]